MKVHSPVPSCPHNSNPLSLWTRTKQSNIFDDLFLHAFLLRQEILHQHFCVTKFCTFILAGVVTLLSKINAQVFVTQTIVTQKILMQK